MYRPEFFSIEELVCPAVFNKFGEIAFQFFDDRILRTIDFMRRYLKKPITVNNWKDGGRFDERGFRCIQCELVKKAIKEGRLHVSPHMTGQGVDLDVRGMVAAEVRVWLVENYDLLPYPVRVENNTNWVHIDTRDTGEKVFLFDP